jgi:tRNA modification GTPase
LGRERALVSAEPGTTRDYLEEPTTVAGLSLLICDTAGVRPVANAVELAGISRTRDLARASDVVVIVLDGSAPLDDLDAGVLALASDTGTPRLFVRAKIDLSPQWEAHDLQRFEAYRDASWEDP